MAEFRYGGNALFVPTKQYTAIQIKYCNIYSVGFNRILLLMSAVPNHSRTNIFQHFNKHNIAFTHIIQTRSKRDAFALYVT